MSRDKPEPQALLEARAPCESSKFHCSKCMNETNRQKVREAFAEEAHRFIKPNEEASLVENAPLLIQVLFSAVEQLQRDIAQIKAKLP